MNFLLQRVKAFAALAIPSVATALIQAAEKASGFDIPTAWELALISVLAGLVVHQVPNKA